MAKIKMSAGLLLPGCFRASFLPFPGGMKCHPPLEAEIGHEQNLCPCGIPPLKAACSPLEMRTHDLPALVGWESRSETRGLESQLLTRIRQEKRPIEHSNRINALMPAGADYMGYVQEL